MHKFDEIDKNASIDASLNKALESEERNYRIIK